MHRCLCHGFLNEVVKALSAPGEIYKGDQSTLIFYRNISFSMEDTETPFGTLVPAKLMGQTSTIIYSKPWAEVYKWTEVRLFFIEINLSVWRTRDAFLIPQSKPNIRNKSKYYIFKTVTRLTILHFFDPSTFFIF